MEEFAERHQVWTFQDMAIIKRSFIEIVYCILAITFSKNLMYTFFPQLQSLFHQPQNLIFPFKTKYLIYLYTRI